MSNEYEGPRYSVQDAADYYSLRSKVPGREYEGRPAWGVLDEEEGGYIAFCTDEASAERIVAALMAVAA